MILTPHFDGALTFTGQPIPITADLSAGINFGTLGAWVVEFPFDIAGNTVSFTNANYSVTLTFQPQPITEDGLHLPENDFDAIADALSNNHQLSGDYIFGVIDPLNKRILINARRLDANLNLTVTGTAIDNFAVSVPFVAAVLPSAKVECNILIENQTVAKLTATVDDGYKAVFDAAKIIQSFIKKENFLPSISLAYYSENFLLWEYQVFPIISGVVGLAKREQAYSVPGCLHKEYLQYNGADFICDSEYKKFLTRQPRTKYIHATATEPISFLFPAMTKPPEIRCFAQYTDGSFFFGDPTGAGALNPDGLWYLNVGYPTIPNFGTIFPDGTTDIVWFAVFLWDATNNVALSEAMTYRLQRKCTNTTLIFSNTFGVWDALHCNEINSENEAEYSDYLQPSKIVNGEYTTTIQSTMQHTQSRIRTFHTGWHSKEYIDYLADELLLSDAINMVAPEDTYIAFTLRTKKLNITTKYQSLFGFRFEMAEAITNQQNAL